MPSFQGDIVRINPEHWIKTGNTYTAKGHGTPVQFVDQNTGDTQIQAFTQGGSFFQNGDMISFLQNDIIPFFSNSGGAAAAEGGAAAAAEGGAAASLLPEIGSVAEFLPLLLL